MTDLTNIKIVAKITVLPANMKPAELQRINGSFSGTCAITIGRAYALTIIIDVMNAQNSMHLPL